MFTSGSDGTLASMFVVDLRMSSAVPSTGPQFFQLFPALIQPGAPLSANAGAPEADIVSNPCNGRPIRRAAWHDRSWTLRAAFRDSVQSSSLVDGLLVRFIKLPELWSQGTGSPNYGSSLFLSLQSLQSVRWDSVELLSSVRSCVNTKCVVNLAGNM